MAKKKGPLETELENADLMTIISGGGTSSIFTRNKLIDYSYSTGIALLDYALGYELLIRNENDEIIGTRNVLGIQAGSYNVISGRTQSMKTTILIQVCANIAYANNGNVIHYDAENRMVKQRVKTLSKLPESWFDSDLPKYVLKNGAIGFDTLQNDVAEIYANKMKYRNILMKDTGVVDDRNKPIILMPPTIMFVDSLQNVIERETEYLVDQKDFDKAKELQNNMTGAIRSKTLRGFLTDTIPMMRDANIIMFMITHKTSNMATNPFMHVKKQFQYGETSERIAGGSALEHNASAIINLTGLSDKDSFFTKEADGFDGNVVLCEPTKASTNESGNKNTGLGFELVVDKRKNGLDNLRTLTLFLNKRGRLKGNKAGYKVIDKSGVEISNRFSWRNIYTDFEKDKELTKAFMLAAKEELETLIAPAPDVAGKINPFDVNKILNEL